MIFPPERKAISSNFPICISGINMLFYKWLGRQSSMNLSMSMNRLQLILGLLSHMHCPIHQSSSVVSSVVVSNSNGGSLIFF